MTTTLSEPHDDTNAKSPTVEPDERRIRLRAGLIAAAALLPLFVLLIQTIGHRWYPAGDDAILTLQTTYVGGEHTPLLGPYSRYGWNHPGPLMFYLLAIPYRLLGSQPWAVLTGVVLLNIATVAALLHLVFTYARERAAAIVAFGTVWLCFGLTPYVLESPWNPDITLLPFGLFLVAAWATRIDVRWLPLTVGVASYLVQSHAGFVPPVALIGAWALFHRYARRPSKRLVIGSVGLALVLWIPIFLDQFFRLHNVSRLVEFFGTDQKQVGIIDSLHIAARELVGLAPWMGGPQPPAPGGISGRPIWTLLIPLTLYAVSVYVCRRQDRRNEEHFLHVCGLAVLASLFAVSRITDEAAYYLVQFWKPVAMLFWAAVVNALIGAVVWRSIRGQVAMVFGAATVLLAVPASVLASRSHVPTPLVQAGIKATFPAVIAQAKADKRVYVEAHGINGGWIADALYLELERKGIDFDTRVEQRNKVGDHHIGQPSDPGGHIVIATGEGIEQVATRTNLRVIVEWNGSSSTEEETRDEVRILQGPPNEHWIIYEQLD